MFAVIDIETVPDVQRWTPPRGPPGLFPPVWAHRIVCIGLLVLDNDYQLVSLDAMTEGAGLGDLFARGNGDADSRERDLLLGFSRRITKLATTGITIVTYNGRTFDIPAIVHRCLAHTVPLPWLWRVRGMLYRYDENGHIDVADLLTNFGASKMHSLDAIAKLVGLPGKVGVDGKQVADLYARGQLTAIANYCCADVVQTAFVLLRLRMIQSESQLILDGYRRNADALRSALMRDARLAEMWAGEKAAPEQVA